MLPPRFYRPAGVRRQSQSNQQGSTGVVEELTAREFTEYLDEVELHSQRYEKLVDHDVARELARIGLPLNQYTEWYWKCDLHNILHFLELRMDEHAQEEIRDYARAMFALLRPLVPHTAEAFGDYRLEGTRLTRLEIDALRTGRDLASENKRERAEWKMKRTRLGLDRRQS